MNHARCFATEMSVSKHLLVTAVAAGMTAAGYANGAIIVPNGSFQTGDLTGWNVHANETANVTVIPNAGPAGAGDYAAHLYLVGDWTFPVLGETPRTLTGELSTTYIAKVDVKAGNVFASKSWDIGILRGWSGNYPAYSFTQDTSLLSDGQWHTLSWQFTTDATNDNGGSQFAFVVNSTGGGGDRDLYVDNFQVAVVPEPAGLGLVGIAGLVALRRRRVAR